MCHRVAVSRAVIGLMIVMSAAQASDVWVHQARGRVSGDTPVAEEDKPKTAPEGTLAAAACSPKTPATCNQQNANSPACYSATQQTRAK